MAIYIRNDSQRIYASDNKALFLARSVKEKSLAIRQLMYHLCRTLDRLFVLYLHRFFRQLSVSCWCRLDDK